MHMKDSRETDLNEAGCHDLIIAAMIHLLVEIKKPAVSNSVCGVTVK